MSIQSSYVVLILLSQKKKYCEENKSEEYMKNQMLF